jgi:nitrogen fixation protein NifX
LYVAAIGGSGAARVVASRVHPIKVNEPEAIDAILDKLQVVLAGTPPPWLRKAMRKDTPRDVSFDDAVTHG